jgi:hypothetical protein
MNQNSTLAVSYENVTEANGISGEQKKVVADEAVGMGSGSVSVSCPHVHSRGGV